MPTQASPRRVISLPEIAHPMLRSNRFDGFSISTMAFPLKRALSAGLRIRTRVT
jgi:hypothetical protein